MMSVYLPALALVLGIPVLGYCVWHALTSARTPQGAAAWVVFLLAAPWFAVPAYAVFGQRKLSDYRAARRRSRELIRGEMMPAHGTVPGPSRPASLERHLDARALRALEGIGGMPFEPGNRLRLLIDGEATFDAICAAIDAARHYVCLQFYIIRDDDTGRRVAAHLTAAAQRGVAVRVIYDGVGSHALSRDWPERLRAAGVKVLNPDRTRGPTSRLQINFRNHRKTVIVDGMRAFVGGHNIGDEYLGRDPRFGHWRDTHLEIAGPVVAQIQTVFAEDWHWACGERLDAALIWDRKVAPGGQVAALVPTGPGDPHDSGSLMFLAAITAAIDRVWLASAYFVPDEEVLAALIAAGLAGKDVRLLLPETIDHYLPWLAAHDYFDEVRAAGVQVYRYRREAGFMHQKVVLIDDDIAAVGTANLDNRSFRLNFESMVFAADPGFAAEVERMLIADMARAERLETPFAAQPLVIRVGAVMARLLAPVL